MGAGTTLRPPDSENRERLLNGLKRRLFKSHGTDSSRHELQTLFNTISNATVCLLAPPFPGEIALVTIKTDMSPNSRITPKRPPSNAELTNFADSDLDRRSRASQSTRGTERRAARPKSKGAPAVVMLTQALVAVGPQVSVTPYSARRGSASPAVAIAAGNRAGSKVGALSLCEGRGPIAVAGCGRIMSLRLKREQERVVECSRTLGWTTSVTCVGAGGRATRTDAGALPAMITFVGPGVVYVQTQSLTAMRRLLVPKPYDTTVGHGVPGFPRAAGRGSGVGLSLKRGLAKRVKAGAKRVLLGLGLFALYVAVYSVATTLLLEGKEGLVRVPQHALQVVRSLLGVARRVAIILFRLGREELWMKEPAGQEVATGNVAR